MDTMNCNVDEQQKQQNQELIAEYRALAKAQGKVWGELSEADITKMIIEHEIKKATAIVQGEASNSSAALVQGEASNSSAALVQGGGQGADPDRPQAQEQQMKLPPQWFDLSHGVPVEVMAHISCLTDGFTVLDANFTAWLFERVYSRPFTTFGYMPAPPNADIAKQVIGKDGYYFKLTQTNANVDFIWHDRVKNNFLFWGERANVIQAMKIVRSRIIKKTTF